MTVDKHIVLARLSRLQLATEDDVREEFVTPLLRLLGYDYARGEVKRGVALSTPYRRAPSAKSTSCQTTWLSSRASFTWRSTRSGQRVPRRGVGGLGRRLSF